MTYVSIHDGGFDDVIRRIVPSDLFKRDISMKCAKEPLTGSGAYTSVREHHASGSDNAIREIARLNSGHILARARIYTYSIPFVQSIRIVSPSFTNIGTCRE